VINSQIAYILHKRAYRETSSILEVLTKDFGRISLMARGSRGKRSKTAGSLLLFTPLVISWQGRGNLPYLKTTERADLKAPELKGKALLCAMYINELMMYLLHKDDAQEAIFEQYHQCLYALEDEAALQISLRKFEIKLLELLGFGLNFHAEADSGESIQAQEIYHYHLEHGPVKSRGEKLPGLPEISGDCLLALADESYQYLADNPRYLSELKGLLRFVISFHLGNKKLKSRELFKPVAQR
ncbi:MAG: DNA repair protein RecO, partial [Proteobacteria bacterium]|nr:DNA repair protein RecO [Pseudomonadota bacterium]